MQKTNGSEIQHRHEVYSAHDLDIAQRLTAVEKQLEGLSGSISEFKSGTEEALQKLLVAKGGPDILTFIGQNWKYIALIVALATGGSVANVLELFK